MHASKLSSDMQQSTHKVRKSALQVVFSSLQVTMQLAEHLTSVRPRLVHMMSALSVKNRRAPSRLCRAYGLKITAMHETSTLPPPPCNCGAAPCRCKSRFAIVHEELHNTCHRCLTQHGKLRFHHFGSQFAWSRRRYTIFWCVNVSEI